MLEDFRPRIINVTRKPSKWIILRILSVFHNFKQSKINFEPIMIFDKIWI